MIKNKENFNFTAADIDSHNWTNNADDYNKDYTNYYAEFNDYFTAPKIDQFYNFNCIYLLPCGLCERTGKQCPKHRWETNWTCSPK